MNPGARAIPARSISSDPVAVIVPASVIRSPVTATSSSNPGTPVPSNTIARRSTRSGSAPEPIPAPEPFPDVIAGAVPRPTRPRARPSPTASPGGSCRTDQTTGPYEGATFQDESPSPSGPPRPAGGSYHSIFYPGNEHFPIQHAGLTPLGTEVTGRNSTRGTEKPKRQKAFRPWGALSSCVSETTYSPLK